MNKFLLMGLALLLGACGSPDPASPVAHAEHEAAAEPVKGPHRGRLLQDGSFAVELAIFESGVPPEYHAWPTLDGKPVSLSDVTLVVDLTRLGNKTSRFTFKPEGDYLRGDHVVKEPHSFTVKVSATHAGKASTWTFDSFEGRTTIAAPIAEAAGVKTGTAGPTTLTETVKLFGRIVANPERQRDVSARFPGLIKTVSKALGETVKAGDVLATVESNDSLRTYSVTAPLAGVITSRSANPGEQTGERTLFTVTDPTAALAELSVFPRDRARIKSGASVELRLADGDVTATGRVTRVDVQTAANQAVTARVAIENGGEAFLPGSFVTGAVAVSAREVPIAVKTAGLQPFRDFTVVYAQVEETYEVRMLELGARHGEWVEVLGGLEPGERYVTENSYLIKADIEKSGASHDH